MDYKLTGEHMPGKYGEWRFDKRTWHDKPPPRGLEQPPANMKNELVRTLCPLCTGCSAATHPCLLVPHTCRTSGWCTHWQGPAPVPGAEVSAGQHAAGAHAAHAAWQSAWSCMCVLAGHRSQASQAQGAVSIAATLRLLWVINAGAGRHTAGTTSLH